MSSIVVEFGSAYIRAGIAGEYLPRLALPVHENDRHLFQTGVFEDVKLKLIEIFGIIIPYVTIRRAKDTRVLLLEDITSRQLFRNALAEALFQYSKIHSLCMYPSLFLPVIATGLRSAMIVDIGLEETRCIAVYDSRALLATLTTTSLGTSTALGNRVTSDTDRNDRLLKIEQELLQHDVGKCEELEQLIGSGSFMEDELGGVSGIILECLLKCPIDVSATVIKHVVFCGGGSATIGLSHEVLKVVLQKATVLKRYERLKACLGLPSQEGEESQGLQSAALKAEITCFAPQLLAWTGGSLLGSCRSIQSRFVREKELKRADDGSLEVPDWLSNDQADWRFLAPIPGLL